MPQATELASFIALSKILTAEKKLDKTLAGQYLDRLKARYPAQMQDLLTAYGTIATDKYVVFELKRRIMDNANLLPIAQQVIRIWYTAEFVLPGPDGKPSPDGKAEGGTQEQFYAGLLWKVIQAHAPTHSTQNYGYWKTPPKAK